jgi:hypothetical protein
MLRSLLSYLKEKYFEHITIKNYVKNHPTYNFIIMKHYSLDKTPRCIKQYPQIIHLNDIPYDIDDELVVNKNILSCNICWENLSCASKIANMQWLNSFYDGTRRYMLVNDVNMIIIRQPIFDIIIPDNVENINIVSSYFPKYANGHARIVYSSTVKKIRICVSDNWGSLKETLDNLPTSLCEIIFNIWSAQKQEVIERVENCLVRIPFGCKITFE